MSEEACAGKPIAGRRGESGLPTRQSPGWRRLPWRKKVLFIAAALVLSLFLSAIVLEMGLRAFNPQSLFPRYVTDSGFGIRVHCADISVYHTTPEFRINVRTNSMGIRADREYAYEKPDGVYRIVGIGDSYTFGIGVEVEDTYLARLESRLRELGEQVEVINLGVVGHGAAEELIMLLEMGLRFEPDMVIVGHTPNDPPDNVRSGLYRLNESGALVRKNMTYLPAVKIRDFLYSLWVYRYLAEHSHLLTFLRDRISYAAQNRIVQKEHEQLGTDSHVLDAALLDEIQRTCRSRGIAFRLLSIPNRARVTPIPGLVFAAISDNEVVHVLRRLDEQRRTERLYWHPSDTHWTPAGHRIAAEALVVSVLPELKRDTPGS